MTELPAGTVTFLFTDIQGSTPLWERDPHAMQAGLAKHNAILEKAIREHGGQVFKVIGDAFQAAFPLPDQAVSAAIAAQRALQAETWDETGPLRVRMGIHIARAEVRGEDYAVSHDLNRLARITAAGQGGQILISASVAGLARQHLPKEISLQDLGEHQLKGMLRPERIYQVLVPDLPAEFPPLASNSAPRHNLPVQLTSFVGRQGQIEAVKRLLQTNRLLTLTGPGGTGKTRLAMEVGAELLEAFEDGVFFVNLAPLADHALVLSAIAHTLGIREEGTQPLAERLKADLAEKQLLLILDNFEHLLEAAPIISELLAAAPQLKVLATSRIPLHLYGEQEFPVPPLVLPGPRPLPSLERLSQYEAVRLFIQRAQAVRPDFAIDNENAPAVAEICYRLDGLPLAIELAAARSKLLSPQALLARLESRLKLLTGRALDVPDRQQTLRATIAWSYNLLEEGEQQLFRRLAVFRGGWSLEAAEVVCWEGITMVVLDAMEGLLDKSLLLAGDEAGAEPRFGMLQTIQEYALEQLAACGEGEAMCRAHADYYLALAEEAEPELRGPEQVQWLDRLEREHDNLRAALEWGQLSNDWEHVARLAAALAWFWYRRGHPGEGRSWLERALERAPRNVNEKLQARMLRGAGNLAWAHGDYEAARTYFEEVLEIALRIDDRNEAGDALFSLGNMAHEQSEYGSARSYLQHSLAIAEEIDDKRLISGVGVHLGHVLSMQGDYDSARSYLEQSLAFAEEIGDQELIVEVLNFLGPMAIDQFDYGSAHSYLKRSLAIAEDIGDKEGIGSNLCLLGIIARDKGDYGAARSYLEQSLAVTEEIGQKRLLGWVLGHLGAIFSRQGDYDSARSYLERGSAIAQEIGQKRVVAIIFIYTGEVALHQCDFAEARSYFERSLIIAEETGDKQLVAVIFHYIGEVALHQGDFAEARSYFERSLTIAEERGDKKGVAHALGNLGSIVARTGDAAMARSCFERSLGLTKEAGMRPAILQVLSEITLLEANNGEAFRASRLWGAAQRLREEMGAGISPVDRERYEVSLAVARQQLGEEAFAEALAEGAAMSLEEAIGYALEPPTEADRPAKPGPQKASADNPAGLTRREVEVLCLIAQGKSDAQVAEELVISPRTVNAHLTSIYSKMGVNSRAAATRFAVEEGLV